MLGAESTLKSFIPRPRFAICAEINGFFLECQTYTLNLLAAYEPSQFALHSPTSAIKDFPVSEFGSPEFQSRLKKVDMSVTFINCFLYFFTPVCKIVT